jgi:hypothetical protein
MTLILAAEHLHHQEVVVSLISEPTGMARHHKNKTRSNTPVWLSLFRGKTCTRRKTGSYPMA